MSLNNMSVNDHILEECAGEDRPGEDPKHRRIMELVAERDELKRQIEDLRAEALAWHSKAESPNNQITITLSFDRLRELWSIVRGNNPYRNGED